MKPVLDLAVLIAHARRGGTVSPDIVVRLVEALRQFSDRCGPRRARDFALVDSDPEDLSRLDAPPPQA